MAAVETHVDATTERCFDVLADPRSYAYWVVGSDEIREADESWPAVGSRFEHIVLGRAIHDHTVVEEVEENRRLRLRARARPLGTAFVTLTLRPEDGGSRVRLEEEPADRISRIFHNRVADRLLHARNVNSLNRLKELAEGRVPIPTGEHPGTTEGSAPERPKRRTAASRAAEGFGRGFAAGLVGGVAMSASTLAEMRLTGRPPSTVPARAIKRMFGIEKLGETAERRTTTFAHFAVSGLTGGAWGAIAAGEVAGPTGTPLLYTMAALPDTAIVPAMGLAPAPWRWSRADVARTAVHHGVFALATASTFARFKG
jgi:uncharacterized protein YndB with AHSA1/START domain